MPANAVTVTAVFEAIPVSTYAVTISGGGTGAIGGGNYAVGATVSITAGTAPAGKQFKNWTTTSNGVTLANANSATTTFTMPANAVTVTANFETVPTYAVTISGGGTGATGAGSYAVGATVTISAGTAPAGQQFKNWTTASNGVTLANANSATTTFTMPANAVMVTAVFEPLESVEIGGQKWMKKNLDIETTNSWCYNNSPDSCAKYGRLYTWAAAKSACQLSGWWLPTNEEWDALVTAAGGSSVAGKALKSTTGWNSNGNGTDTYGFSALPGGTRNRVGSFSSAGDYGRWWTASANANNVRDIDYNDYVNAYYQGEDGGFSARCVQRSITYAVTISGGGTSATGGGNYAAGATVSISAGTAPSGQTFKNWTTSSSGVTLANANSATTTFTMPANAVTVTANFEAIKYTVTVSGGTGSGNYVAGATVSISVSVEMIPDNQQFKFWTTSSGVKLTAANGATTFTMPASAVTVTAVFEAIESVVIGGKRWMKKNMNTEKMNSWCYGNSVDSCTKYGRLYTWAAAQSACPTRWRLPDTADWRRLVEVAGGASTAGIKLKSTSGWYNNSNGSDTYGFCIIC